MIFLLFSLLFAPEKATFHDPDSGLKMEFPAGWELQSDMPEKTAQFRGNQPEQRWLATGTESPRPWYDVIHLKFLVQSMGLRAQKYQVMSAEQIGTDRYQGIAVNFQMELSEQPILYRIYALGNEDHAFLLVFGSKAENWALLEKELEAILKSVRFDVAAQGKAPQPRKPNLAPLKIMAQPGAMAATGKLLEALGKDRVEHAEVEKLVAEGADVNGLGKSGTPLSIAVAHDHRMAALWLLDHGADLSHPVNDIVKLSIQASLPVRMLLESRWEEMAAKRSWIKSEHDHQKTRPVVSPNREPDPNAALFSALTRGELERAEKALANGANPREKHPQMGVNSLVLVSQLIKELDALNLDTKGWRDLESQMNSAEKSN